MTDPMPRAEEPREMTERELEEFFGDAQMTVTQSLKDRLRATLDHARRERETETMRLVACDVVAMSDSAESAPKARQMHSDYWSAALESVIRRVDECMALRSEVSRLRGLLGEARVYVGVPMTGGDLRDRIDSALVREGGKEGA